MLKRLIPALFLASSLWGYTSLVVPAGAFVRITVPAGAPFTSFGDYRIEARLDNITLPASGTQNIIVLGRSRIQLDAAGNLCGKADGDTINTFGSFPCVTVTNGMDVLIRQQRFGATEPTHDPSPGSAWFEVQDLGTGNWLPLGCEAFAGQTNPWKSGCPISTANNVSVSGTTSNHGETNGIGNATVTVQVAYLKWFSTTVHPNAGTALKSQMVNEATQADLLDLRFEGNYNDSSSGAYGFTLTTTAGSPTVTTTSTSHNPYCYLPQQIFNKNFGTSTLLPNAYALDPSGTLTYAWSQLSGPNTATFSSTSVANPNITGALFGSYIFQLIATDGNAHASTCSMKDGFVDADSNNMATSGNPQIDELITGSTTGRQPMLGTNPWEWEDDRAVAEQNQQMTNANTKFSLSTVAPWDNQLAGTIAVTTGSATITGFGTSFQSTICTGTSPNGFIVIYYPWAQTLNGHGWRTMNVSSCGNNTSLTMTAPWSNTYLPVAGNSATCTTGVEASCWHYAFVSYATYNNVIEQNSPPNFYDGVMASVALYYRSGIDDYLTFARQYADMYWEIRMDAGNNYYWGEGRQTFYLYLAQMGMIWRSIDCPSCNMSTGIEQIAKFANDNLVAQSYVGGNWKQIGGSLNSDPRDMGNATMFMALCAHFDTNSTGAATCRSQLADVMTRGWTPSRFPDGNFYSLYGLATSNSENFTASWLTNTSITLTAGSSVGTCSGAGHCPWSPPAPTVTVSTGATGTTTYSYVFLDAGLTSAYPSPVGSLATGPASLGGGNSLDVSMPTISGVTYNLYRAAGGTTGLVATVTAAGTTTVVNDNGLTATGGLPSQPGDSQWIVNQGGVNHAQTWWFFNTPGSMPLDNTGSQGIFYPVQTGAGTIQLQDLNGTPVNFTGTSGTYGWMIGGRTGAVGYGVQPYMLGFASTAFMWTEKAMRCTSVGVPTNCDNTIAGNAQTYVSQVASFQRTQGYDAPWSGMYYWVGPNCALPVASNNMGCRDADGEVASRLLTAEGQRAIINAYLYTRDPLLRTFGDLLKQGEWYRPGWTSAFPDTSGFSYDGHFNNAYVDGFGGYMTGTQATKYWAMPFGLGSGAAWAWLRQLFNGTSRTGWKGTGTVH
jgi:hypothetical protein